MWERGQSQALAADSTVQRMRVTIHEAVQGVGFRPFTYRLAQVLGLRGWVNNGVPGVIIEAEGSAPTRAWAMSSCRRQPESRDIMARSVPRAAWCAAEVLLSRRRV